MSQCYGKIMLAGEYAVLYGGRALAVTVDCSLRVEVSKNSGFDGLVIFSNIWSEPKKLTWSEASRAKEPAFSIAAKMMTIIEKKEHACTKKKTGLNIFISTDNFKVSYGVGSSSALRIATIKAVAKYFDYDISDKETAKLAYQDQLEAQGKASGYDILTQLYGGVICSTTLGKIDKVGKLALGKDRQWPGEHQSHQGSYDFINRHIHIFTAQTGSATGPLVQITSHAIETRHLQQELLALSESLIDKVLDKKPDLSQVILSSRQLRAFFKELPCASSKIYDALSGIEAEHPSFTWKQTGAGGEDAILLIGPYPDVAAKNLKTIGYCKAPFNFIDSINEK